MTHIIRWDPFRELSEMRSTRYSLFGRHFIRPVRIVSGEGDGFFPVDLYETDDEVVVQASLPGVKPGEVQVSVTGNTLTVRAETEAAHEEQNPSYYRKERRYGAFQRSLTLPVRVDADKANATFENGVLDLRLPKAPEARSKTIEVKPKGAAGGKAS